MKLENINEAEKAARAYEKAKSDLSWVKSSRLFEVSCGPTADSVVIVAQSVGTEQSMYSGTLAAAVRVALIAYKEGFVAMEGERLRRLGVDVVD